MKSQNQTFPYPKSVRFRLLEGLFRLGDALFLPQAMMACNALCKRNTRPLTSREIGLARMVFGESIDYQRVRMDVQSVIGCRKYHFAYVGFNIINSWGPLPDAIFIHEMMHVWQYQHLGSVYIPRALWAQRTLLGYNYGGIRALQLAQSQGKGLLAFNYEQQGDIVADYFRLKTGERPRWCAPNPDYLPVFEAITAILDKERCQNKVQH